MSDLLLLLNTLLGIFAGLSTGYLAMLTHQPARRIFWGSIAVVCAAAGIAYGAAVLGYVSSVVLGPFYLRPVLAILLGVLVFAPLANKDGMAAMEQEIETLRAELIRQDDEIKRLNEVIKTLVRQFGLVIPPSVRMDSPVEQSVAAVMVLVVAVEPGKLKIRDEVDAIFDSGLHYEYLADPVSRNRLIGEMERLRPPALHLLGHMTATGIPLADGMASVGWWRRLFARYAVQFVFANGCESLDVVDALFVDGVQCVIGVREDVKDEAAVEFARQFYAWLAAGRKATDAVELAKLALGREDAEQVVIRGEWQINGE